MTDISADALAAAAAEAAAAAAGLPPEAAVANDAADAAPSTADAAKPARGIASAPWQTRLSPLSLAGRFQSVSFLSSVLC